VAIRCFGHKPFPRPVIWHRINPVGLSAVHLIYWCPASPGDDITGGMNGKDNRSSMPVRRGRLCLRGSLNWAGHCHCESSWRQTTSPMTNYLGVPNDVFNWTRAEPALFEPPPGLRPRLARPAVHTRPTRSTSSGMKFMSTPRPWTTQKPIPRRFMSSPANSTAGCISPTDCRVIRRPPAAVERRRWKDGTLPAISLTWL
jgi:hypothetical protein